MCRAHHLWVVGLLVLTATSTFGQAVGGALPAVGFDCWIGNNGKPYYIHYIRCIPDRDLNFKPEIDERAERLLEELHQELHRGAGAGAEAKLTANLQLVREAAGVWNIRINAYPYEWSWAEGRPQALVRAVLCPADQQCAVMLRKD